MLPLKYILHYTVPQNVQHFGSGDSAWQYWTVGSTESLSLCLHDILTHEACHFITKQDYVPDCPLWSLLVKNVPILHSLMLGIPIGKKAAWSGLQLPMDMHCLWAQSRKVVQPTLSFTILSSLICHFRTTSSLQLYSQTINITAFSYGHNY